MSPWSCAAPALQGQLCIYDMCSRTNSLLRNLQVKGATRPIRCAGAAAGDRGISRRASAPAAAILQLAFASVSVFLCSHYQNSWLRLSCSNVDPMSEQSQPSLVVQT